MRGERERDALTWEALFFKGLCSCSESSLPQDVDGDIFGGKLQGFAQLCTCPLSGVGLWEPGNSATRSQNLCRVNSFHSSLPAICTNESQDPIDPLLVHFGHLI